MEQTAKTFQDFHGNLTIDDGGGSAYSLGDIDFSPLGIIKKSPAALNVTFSGPIYGK